MKSHTFHSQAAEEYTNAIAYHIRIDPKIGKCLATEIDDLIEAICQHPERYREVRPGVQRHFSDVFPYAIFYMNQPKRIWIVAIMHMSRKPDYWKSRIA